MLVTLIMVVLLALVALAIVLTGPIVTAIAQPLGVGSTAVTIWDIATWPVLLIVAITMFAVLFNASPSVKLVGFKWVSPGALLAVMVWLIASALFARSMSRTSTPMTRPTAPSAAWSSSSYGCGSRTPRSYSAWSSTPNANAAVN
jgi:uncharacterized BrkB/YihY/UPF0761 family membrane protein